MNLSKLINKAVETFDKQFTEYGRATFCCCGDQCDGDHTDDIKDIKSFLTKCIQESYEAGKEEEKQRSIKEVDMVKKCIYEIKKVGDVIIENESLEVITKYQAVNCVNLMEHTPLSLTQEVKVDYSKPVEPIITKDNVVIGYKNVTKKIINSKQK